MSELPDERLGLPSASSWRRYELCHGSFQLEGEARRLGQLAHQDSPAARRGSLIHSFLAGELDEDGNPIVLDDEAQKTADFLQERAQGEVVRIFGEEKTLQLSEKRLWLTVGGKKVASGKFDRVVYSPTLCLIQDFKTGFSPIDDIELNAQLRFLTVVCGLHLPNSVQEFVAQLISGPFGIFEKRFTRATLAAAWDDVMATLRKINDPHAPLTPGVEQCAYCPAAAICQPCRDLLSPPTKFQITTLPDDPDRAAKLLDEIAILEGVFEEVKKHYAERLTNDAVFRISGWNMIPGPQRREVANWKAARARLEEFVGAEELEQLANYSIPSVEKLVAKALKLKAKDASVKLAEILGDLLTVRQGNLCLRRTKGEPKLVTLELP